MDRDTIAEVEIDREGRLHIVPTMQSFPYIYREAMEVQWDAARGSLHSPKPRDWSYSRWFQQALAAAAEQGCDLRLADGTRWVNVEAGIKAEIMQAAGNVA